MITIIRDETHSPPIASVISEMEKAAAVLATARVGDVWPGSGASAPVVNDTAMEFREAYAPYVRRSGDPEPLISGVVPAIAFEAADDTFQHFAAALSRAIAGGP